MQKQIIKEKKMHNTLNLQLINADCPKDKDKNNCPARQYIANLPELFVISMNENMFTLARPYGDARGKYEGALFDIFQICQKCQGRTK